MGDALVFLAFVVILLGPTALASRVDFSKATEGVCAEMAGEVFPDRRRATEQPR